MSATASTLLSASLTSSRSSASALIRRACSRSASLVAPELFDCKCKFWYAKVMSAGAFRRGVLTGGVRTASKVTIERAEFVLLDRVEAIKSSAQALS